MNNINHRGEKLHHKLHRHAHHHVNRLRGKSDTHKKMAALTIASSVTLIVFVLWYFLSLPKILETYRITKSENERLDNSPVNKIKDIFKGEEADPNINNIEIKQ